MSARENKVPIMKLSRNPSSRCHNLVCSVVSAASALKTLSTLEIPGPILDAIFG